MFAVANHSFLVTLPRGLILAWPVVFAVTDHSFLVTFSGSLIHTWLVVFFHNTWVSCVAAFLDLSDLCLSWYLTDSVNYLTAAEPKRSFPPFNMTLACNHVVLELGMCSQVTYVHINLQSVPNSALYLSTEVLRQ